MFSASLLSMMLRFVPPPEDEREVFHDVDNFARKFAAAQPEDRRIPVVLRTEDPDATFRTFESLLDVAEGGAEGLSISGAKRRLSA